MPEEIKIENWWSISTASWSRFRWANIVRSTVIIDAAAPGGGGGGEGGGNGGSGSGGGD